MIKRLELDEWVFKHPRAAIWIMVALAVPYFLTCVGISLAVVAGGNGCGG